MLLQPDGKILVCGQIDNYDYVVSFFIARYNPTGTLDTSFGENGKILAPYDYYDEHVGGGMALQPDGKIIAAGYKFYAFSSADFAVNRYNSNGTPDTSFGTDGAVITTIENSAGYSMRAAVALQADGKIVVGVDRSNGNFFVIRYNPDGTLDNSFGTGGKVITSLGTYADINGVVIQSDGKIVVVGDVGDSQGSHFAVVRYNSDGSLDNTLGTGGKVITALGTYAGIGDVVLQPDGKIVVAGGLGAGSAIVRYNANGSLDTSFAANGVFTTENNFQVQSSVVLQPDGKIVAFGEGRVPGSNDVRGFALTRLNPNGSPDTSFGTEGRSITPVGTAQASRAYAGALQSDGKILAFGDGTIQLYATQPKIAIIRYRGDLAAPGVTLSGRVTTPDGRGVRNASVSITDSTGIRRTATTSSFGFYSFDNVATGGNYTIGVQSRLFRFGSRTVQVDAALTNVDFVGLE